MYVMVNDLSKQHVGYLFKYVCDELFHYYGVGWHVTPYPHRNLLVLFRNHKQETQIHLQVYFTWYIIYARVIFS